MKKVASALLLLVGVLIALGAYGHSFLGRLAVDAQLDRYPLDWGVYSMLYVTWYFVGGVMLLFGVTILMAWLRFRRGERSLLWVTALIGVLYLCTGIGGMVYRHGDPFMSVFVLEGALLLGCSLILARRPPAAVPAPGG